jgi:hypothetical protein
VSTLMLLFDTGKGMDLVPRVDPLRRIATKEVLVIFQAAFFFQYRHAVFFRTARINRGFVHHHIALFQYPSDVRLASKSGTRFGFL